MTRSAVRPLVVGLSALALLAVGLAPAEARGPDQAATARPVVRSAAYNTEKIPVATGYGGAVASVDPEATAAGLTVLRQGGNAVDAAVATAAALGVTEPYSTGVGGGGYFVFYNARTGKVQTIDGRETAPKSIPNDAFIDPATGKPYNFTPELVTSGVSVGVPGTPATWQRAVDRWGRRSLAQNLRPAIQIAERGFVVDQTFRQQTLDNKVRFSAFPATAALYLPGGDAPAVGSIFRNPDLADTYETIAKQGARAIYRGPIARDIVSAARDPQKSPTTTLPVPKGYLQLSDLSDYTVRNQAPTHIRYRGLDVYSMAPSSSGGTTVGEALNIMENQNFAVGSRARALHYYLDASALAYADRNAFVGDPAYVNVPTKELLSQDFADCRAALIPTSTRLITPVKAGTPGAGCAQTTPASRNEQGKSTSHLVAADRWGNVVSYTLTIEQTGGSGILVPGRGFLLNNELTDFSAVYDPADPNRIQPGKRPRSSMAPTIVLKNGKPFIAVGSPGGATIITTVLQTLFNRIDLGMTLPQAVEEPRASLRNTATVSAEPGFVTKYQSVLAPYGYTLTPTGDGLTSASEIGAVAALEFKRNGSIEAVAEKVRRGGGSAGVVRPTG